MKTLDYYTLTEAGRMLGMSREAVSNLVRVWDMTTTNRGFAGTAKWLTRAQVEEIAVRLNIEVAWPEAVAV